MHNFPNRKNVLVQLRSAFPMSCIHFLMNTFPHGHILSKTYFFIDMYYTRKRLRNHKEVHMAFFFFFLLLFSLRLYVLNS